MNTCIVVRAAAAAIGPFHELAGGQLRIVLETVRA
jgi:hypothetical protein